MRTFLSATLVAMLLLGAGAPAAAVHPALRCTAPDGVTRFKVTLPHTARAIRRGEALVIVAIGSSSTQGVGASDQAHTYLALLAEELRRRSARRSAGVRSANPTWLMIIRSTSLETSSSARAMEP